MAVNTNVQVTIDAVDRTSAAFKSAAQGVKRLQGKMAKVQQTFRTAGRKMQRVGGSLSRNVSLPLAAAGGAAVKFASDFEQGLKQTRSQVGMTADETERVGEVVEEVATKTGQSMSSIFEAQRLAQSSTLDMAEANKLVQTSAEASAAGLGNMKTLVNLGTTAAQKFGDSLEGGAKRGIEVMAAAAQDSQTSVGEFADGLLKGSAQMDILGLSMQEGSAIFSRLSDAAANAKVAGTQFRAFLKSVQKPSKEMGGLIRENFDSVSNFRKELEKNAVPTLFELKDAAQENGKTLSSYMSNVRAAAGSSNFFASSQETVQETLNKTRDSVGLLSEMFQQSASFSRLLKRAFNAVKVALRPVGNVIIEMVSPALAKFTVLARRFSDWFQNLSPRIQKFIVAIGGIAAAAGPVIAALGTFSILIGSISAPILIAVAAIGALVAIGYKLAQNWDAVTKQAKKLWSQFKDTAAFQTLRKHLELLWANIRHKLLPTLKSFWQEHGPKVKSLFKTIAKIAGGALVVGIHGIIGAVNLAVAAFTGFVGILEKIISYWNNTVLPFFKDFGAFVYDFITDPVGTTVEKFKELYKWIGNAMERLQEYMGEVASAERDGFLGNAADWFGDTFERGANFWDFSGSVDDAVISPSGNVVSTSPQDYLIATKNPSSLARGRGGMTNIVHVKNNEILGEDDVGRKIGGAILDEINMNNRYSRTTRKA